MKTNFRPGIRGSLILAFIIVSNMAVFTKTCQAKEHYDLIAFMNECQKMSSDPGVIAIVQWIPDEWWQLTLKRAGVAEERIKEVLKLFEPYASFIVIHGKISSSGLPSFTPDTVLRQHLSLKDEAGRYYMPIDDEDVSAGVRNAIIMIKPIFSNMLGRMGDNMNFFFFTGKTKEGEKICQASQNGAFSIYIRSVPEIKDQIFEWILPLNSLVPLKICPKCKREAQGAWKYCPWCGTPLISGEGQEKK